MDTGNILGGFSNTSTITGTNGNGIEFQDIGGAGFTNSGLIAGRAEGIDINILNGGFRNNAGATILSSDGSAVDSTGVASGDFFNAGRIESTAASNEDAVDNNGALVNGDFINTGVIRGTGHGVDWNDNFNGGDFFNSGLIQGGSGEGADLTTLEDGNFTNTGTIRSASTEALDINNLEDGDAVDGVQKGNFSNSGTIDGATNGVDIGTVDGDFTNSGAISGGSAAGVEIDVLGGAFTNTGTIEGGAEGVLFEPSSAGATVTLVNQQGGLIEGGTAAILSSDDSGSTAMTVTNAGTIIGAVTLNSEDDSFTLTRTGTVSGVVDGGADTDALGIDAGAGASRSVDEGDFINFETVTLNGGSGATGTLTLSAAGAPNTTATLDAGGGAGTSITVSGGELNLTASDSSIRAETVTISSGATLSGNGGVYNGVGVAGGGVTTVSGNISPGNSIGLLSITGDYTQTGNYIVEFRPPQDLTNIVGGSLIGRNVLDDAVALSGQDADLIDITGVATLTGGTVVLQPQGALNEYDAAFNAAGNTNNEIRYLILRADGGLGGTNFAALSPSGAATLETTATDVILVIDDAVLTVIVSEPPDALVSQAGVLWELARTRERVRCDTEGLTSQKSCFFAEAGWRRADVDTQSENRPGGDSDTPSGFIGGGRQIQPGLWVGAAVGYQESDLDLNAGGDADIDRLSAQLWSHWIDGAWDLSAWAKYARYDVDTVRDVSVLDAARADYVGHQVGGTVELRYRAAVADGYTIGPVVGFDGAWLRREDFSEEGGGLENFSADRDTRESLQGSIGMEAVWRGDIAKTPMRLSGQLGLAQELLDTDAEIEGSFGGAPDVRFDESSTDISRTRVLFDAAAVAQLSPTESIRLGYGLSSNSDVTNYALSMRFTTAF